MDNISFYKPPPRKLNPLTKATCSQLSMSQTKDIALKRVFTPLKQANGPVATIAPWTPSFTSIARNNGCDSDSELPEAAELYEEATEARKKSLADRANESSANEGHNAKGEGSEDRPIVVDSDYGSDTEEEDWDEVLSPKLASARSINGTSGAESLQPASPIGASRAIQHQNQSVEPSTPPPIARHDILGTPWTSISDIESDIEREADTPATPHGNSTTTKSSSQPSKANSLDYVSQLPAKQRELYAPLLVYTNNSNRGPRPLPTLSTKTSVGVVLNRRKREIPESGKPHGIPKRTKKSTERHRPPPIKAKEKKVFTLKSIQNFERRVVEEDQQFLLLNYYEIQWLGYPGKNTMEPEHDVNDFDLNDYWAAKKMGRPTHGEVFTGNDLKEDAYSFLKGLAKTQAGKGRKKEAAQRVLNKWLQHHHATPICDLGFQSLKLELEEGWRKK